MTDLGGRRSDLWGSNTLDRLAKLWGGTTMTVNEIADALGHGYTKGAVIGKIHRTPSIQALRPVVRKRRLKKAEGEGAMEVSQILDAPACEPLPLPDVTVADPPPAPVHLGPGILTVIEDGVPVDECAAKSVVIHHIRPPPNDPSPKRQRISHVHGGAAALERARTATAKIKAKTAPAPEIAASEPENVPPPQGRIKPEDFIATAPPTVKDFDPPRADGLLSIWQLTESSCHWPVGDPLTPAFGYCGQPKPFGPKQPYCEDHQARAETPKATWLRRNAA